MKVMRQLAMAINLSIRAFVVAICMTHGQSALASSAPLHIMIDPGHGGNDVGASRDHLKESEIALRVSNMLAELLKEDPNFKVSLTRTTDTKLTLERRTIIARDAKADLFVSIHLNSSTDRRARGIEFYFQNQLPADEEAMFLAARENETDGEETSSAKKSAYTPRSDLARIIEDLQRNHRINASSELSKLFYEAHAQIEGEGNLGSRTIRQAPFHVVSRVDMPSVLVELGFLSHPVEGEKLAQPDYQKRLARSLYQGLIEYKERIDKEPSQNLKSPLPGPVTP